MNLFYHRKLYENLNLQSFLHTLIYLLKDTLLKDTPAFQDFSYYDQTEALAEFYTRKISGGHQKFIFNEEYIQYYNQKAQESPNITPKELFFLLTNENDAK